MNYKGIDIYNGQGRPDFAKVKGDGISFVILKATEGVDFADPSFTANAQAAKDAGLPIGAYHFLRATPINQQAQDFLAEISGHGPYAMLAIDVEDQYKDGVVVPEISNLGKEAITDRVLTIYKAIRAAGYTCPIYVYASKSWFGYLIDTDACRQAGMKIWMAAYSDDNTPENTDHSDICDMWQWRSDGRVNGIIVEGKAVNVDMDVSYSAITDTGSSTQEPTSSGGVSVSVTPSGIDIEGVFSNMVAFDFGTNPAAEKYNADDDAYYNPHAVKIGNVVFLFGLFDMLHAASDGDTIAVLPSSFAPKHQQILTMWTNYGPKRIDIMPSGILRCAGDYPAGMYGSVNACHYVL